jgi:hypothetical protein
LTGPAFALLKKNTPVRINHIFKRHGLGIGDIDGLAFCDTLIEFIGRLGRAFFRAGTAGNALVHIYIAGGFLDGNSEVALFSPYVSEF